MNSPNPRGFCAALKAHRDVTPSPAILTDLSTPAAQSPQTENESSGWSAVVKKTNQSDQEVWAWPIPDRGVGKVSVTVTD
jgi:hypothetical protein